MSLINCTFLLLLLSICSIENFSCFSSRKLHENLAKCTAQFWRATVRGATVRLTAAQPKKRGFTRQNDESARFHFNFRKRQQKLFFEIFNLNVSTAKIDELKYGVG